MIAVIIIVIAVIAVAGFVMVSRANKPKQTVKEQNKAKKHF